MNPADLRPTHVRYYIVALTTFVALLLYLDRICLSQAELYIRQDLGLTRPQMGLAMSAFFLTYALFQVPGGWLADRYGARLMLSIYLALWSTFTGLVGLAHSLTMVIVFRLMIGLFEAGAYPACAGLIRRWVPLESRGLASGIVSLGGRFGNTVGAFTTALLIGSFLPSDAPNEFQAGDVLETRLFSRAACDGSDTLSGQLGERLRSLLPADVAQRLRSVGLSNKNIKLDDLAHMQELLPGDREAVAAALNLLMKQPDLQTMLAKSADQLPKDLRARATDFSLSAAERERFHRLAVEAIFPDSLRQLHGPGWRPTMMVYGLIGVLVAGGFWWYFRDRPDQHSSVNAAERDLILGVKPLPEAVFKEDVRAGLPHESPSDQGVRAGVPPASTAPTFASPPPAAAGSSFPLTALSSNLSMWLMSFVQFTTNVGWVFLMTWFPTYLADLHVPRNERGLMTAVVFFVGLPGLIVGGWWTDWMTTRFGKRWGRAFPVGVTRFVSAGAFALGLLTADPWLITVAMCFVALGTDLGLPAMWGYCLDVGGRYTGAVLGWGNMFGNFGAFVGPLLLSHFADSKRWDIVFMICAGTFVLSGIAGLFIDARSTVVHEETATP